MSISLSVPGTYALLLSTDKDLTFQVGALGLQSFNSGYYIYVGSAHGPGGLKARLKHHIRFSENPHWHIDYLRNHTKFLGVWVTRSHDNLEHIWAESFHKLTVPNNSIKGFGCSDCKCISHLYFHKSRLISSKVFSALRIGDQPEYFSIHQLMLIVGMVT
ncbi:MAG: GIY-YIG nuclease family protein [Candidatus Marinimicrobia bacterium]|nr:GIY-YIG nuclease family protein [Candidatus Neomarinimicrobiota bacterium]